MENIKSILLFFTFLTLSILLFSCVVVVKEHPGKSPNWHYKTYPPGPPPHSNAGGNHPDQKKYSKSNHNQGQGNQKNSNNKSKKNSKSKEYKESEEHPDQKSKNTPNKKSKHPDGY